MTEGNKTVLIADDEKLLAEAIAATVALEGMETIIAHGGNEALSLARKLRPDVILLDVSLPGLSGIEVCARLKTDPEARDIPVILVTGKAEQEDRAVGMAAGARAYVTKPFSPVELINLVKVALADGAVDDQPRRPSIDTMSHDQLTVYAHDLKELWQRERQEREELERARERLAELDRIKAEFLGAVTHELLTPFATISTTLELLERACKACNGECEKGLRNLGDQIAGLHQHIRGVVKFAELVAKQRELDLGWHRLDEVIPQAVQPVVAMAQSRDIDLRILLPPHLVEICIDAELVGEAVFQMAHNAVKFNRPGGHARVRAQEADGVVIIQVSDTGIGLTPERVAALGRPFEQSADALRRGQEGLGVGWALVCYVAEMHHGWTDVKSPGEGQGSRFFLALPVAPSTSNHAPSARN